MTRQMADDEVLRVLDKLAALPSQVTNLRGEYVVRMDTNAVRRYVAALQAERDYMGGLLNTCIDLIEEGTSSRQSYDYRARAEGCVDRIKEFFRSGVEKV